MRYALALIFVVAEFSQSGFALVGSAMDKGAAERDEASSYSRVVGLVGSGDCCPTSEGDELWCCEG